MAKARILGMPKTSPSKNGWHLRQTEHHMRKLFLITLAALTLTGCNTIDGIGRDISGGAQRTASWF